MIDSAQTGTTPDGSDDNGERDFFVSYAQADQPWAEWISWQLEQAGFTVVLQAWDFVPGMGWIHEMDRAVIAARRTIAVLSPAYLTSDYGKVEWQAAMRDDPLGRQRLLIPVRIAECSVTGMFAGVVWIDIVGLSEEVARNELVEGVGGAVSGRRRPLAQPHFPFASAGGGAGEPYFPALPSRVRLLDRVAEVARSRNPDARITTVEADGDRPGFIDVAWLDDGFPVRHPVGVSSGGLTMAVVDEFVTQIHRDYEEDNPRVTSELVYSGDRAPDDVIRSARHRGVRVSSLAEYQRLWDPRGFVARQTARLEADRVYPPDLYVPQRFRMLDDTGRTQPSDDLFERVVDWLDADQARLVLVLGDFGRGKTFLMHELARLLPERLPNLTPVLIELGALEKSHDLNTLIAQHFGAAHEDRVDFAAFRYMLANGQIALLFDGFDELALRTSYERATDYLATLLSAVDGRAKVVLSSRTQHFQSHEQVRTALGDQVQMIAGRRLVELVDFDESQISAFLVRLFDGDAARAAERLDLIRRVGDLPELSRNPRMLGFIAALDPERLGAAQADDGQISAGDLYREIVSGWLELEVSRTGGAQALDERQRFEAVTALAMRMWQSRERAVRIDDLADVVTEVFDDLADQRLSAAQAAHVIGSRTLLVRTAEGMFSFVHSSIAEFLVAAEIARQLSDGVEDPSPLSLREMSPLTVDFLRDLADPAACAAWATRTLADAERGAAAKRNALAVTSRLGTRASAPADLSGRDLRGTDLSGTDLQKSDLTGADLTDALLVGTDLRGAILRNAILVGARLDRARLAGADLTGADLTGALLLGADLGGATVTGSRWRRAAVVGVTAGPDVTASAELRDATIVPGQRVTTELAPAGFGVSHSFTRGALPEPVAFSPDGDDLAVGSEDGAVVICDVHSGLPLRTLSGHTGRVSSLAYSPDGSVLATASNNGGVRLWDPSTGTCLRTLTGHQGGVWRCAFHPAGGLLVTSGADGGVRLWDLATGLQVEIDGTNRDYWVWSVTFSADGRHLAATCDDRTVRIWDTRTSADDGHSGGAPVAGRAARRVLVGHTGPVWSAAFSPDGDLLASGGDDGTIRLWEPASGRAAGVLTGHTGPVWSVSFSADGQLLASAGDDGTARLWDPEGRDPPTVLAGHGGPVRAVAFSPVVPSAVPVTGPSSLGGGDPGLLATSSDDHTVGLWDPLTGLSQATLTGHTGPIWSAVFSPSGDMLATTSNDDTIRLWDPATGTARHRLAGHTDRMYAAAFSPDGSLLATTSNSGDVRLWDPVTVRQRSVLRGHTSRVWPLAFSADGTLLATTSDDRTVRLWNPVTGTHHHTLTGQADRVWSVAFSPDGTLLATANDDDTVGLWDRATDRPRHTLAGHAGRVRSVAFSPDGQLVATACDDRTVRVWDTATGKVKRTMTGHTDRVWCAVFSPDGALLATASNDRTIRLWNPETGKRVRVLTGHGDRVWSLVFSRDGRTLASSSSDRTVRLWDPATGAVRHVLSGHTGPVWWVGMTPGGDQLSSASDDGTVRLWDLTGDAAPRVRATLLGLADGWAAIAPDGRYKLEGDPAGRFWHVVGLSRFEPGELDPYVPSIERLDVAAPFAAQP